MAFEICNERELSRLFSGTPDRSARPGALPGVRLDRKDAARPACVEENPKQKTLQLNKEQGELSSIAAISLFTVKESTVLTSSIKN